MSAVVAAAIAVGGTLCGVILGFWIGVGGLSRPRRYPVLKIRWRGFGPHR